MSDRRENLGSFLPLPPLIPAHETRRRVLEWRQQQKVQGVSEPKLEDVQPSITYWMSLAQLNQEILDDVTSIYCHVYGVDPEELSMTPELDGVRGFIADAPGFYEEEIAGYHNPALEIRRLEIDKAGLDGMLIRFRASGRKNSGKRNEFQEAVDFFLTDHLKVGQPLSHILLSHKKPEIE